MSKLWEKGYDIDRTIEEFTVGRDWQLDQLLVPADCAASQAHATMLAKIGILSQAELEEIRRELAGIVTDHREGKFVIAREDEDCHTAIENRLTRALGDAGKKIHTGRSRNDQVLAALRLYSRAFLFSMSGRLVDLVDSLHRLASRGEGTAMPGRTHLQIAMPSSVGLWAAAYAEELLDDARLVWNAFELTDQSPLGSAASYGVPLPLDRELVADLLGFSRVQNNVLYANNSRGKFESVILDAIDQVGLTLSKLAEDLILFSLPELGYFHLPDKLCSGSSIMPQKKNPDALELLRAKSATLSAYSAQVKGIIRSLPSGYNRDFQETKEPFLRGAELALMCTRIMNITIDSLEVDEERLSRAFEPAIFATDAALERVSAGASFRDAYREVAANLAGLSDRDPAASIKRRTAAGTTGNLGLAKIAREAASLREQVNGARARSSERLDRLFGFPVTMC